MHEVDGWELRFDEVGHKLGVIPLWMECRRGKRPKPSFFRREVPKKSTRCVNTSKSRNRVSRFEESSSQSCIVRGGGREVADLTPWVINSRVERRELWAEWRKFMAGTTCKSRDSICFSTARVRIIYVAGLNESCIILFHVYEIQKLGVYNRTAY